MEEEKTQRKSRRKRRNAMQSEEDILELEEREEKKTLAALAMNSKENGRTCAPADYKNIEELIEDPVNEERERRRKAVEKWTKESHDKFASGLAIHGKRFRKLAEPLPDLTAADCVEHYYMAKPFHFDFEEWRAQEKIRAERSLALTAEESKGPSHGAQISEEHQGPSSYEAQTSEERQGPSSHGAQTSSSPSEHPLSSEACTDLEETEEKAGKLVKGRVEMSVAKPIVIEIDDEPDVIVVE